MLKKCKTFKQPPLDRAHPNICEILDTVKDTLNQSINESQESTESGVRFLNHFSNSGKEAWVFFLELIKDEAFQSYSDIFHSSVVTVVEFYGEVGEFQ